MFKKALVLFMAVVMVFSLVACGNDDEGKTTPNNKATVNPDVTPKSASKVDPNQSPSLDSSKKVTNTAEWPTDKELLETVIKPEFGTLDSVNDIEDGSIIIKLRGATTDNLSDYYDAYKAAGFEGDYTKEVNSFNVSDSSVNVKVSMENDSGAMTITVTPK